MPSSCVFELNKPEAIYFSGETITGTIILNTSKNKNVRDVSILFLGEGKVRWTESRTHRGHDGRTTTHRSSYTSYETYINNSTQVYGDGILPAGRHIFTFNLPLSPECPTSLEAEYGHIRYEIILKINRYYKFNNEFKKPVNIIKTVDLNLNPGYKLPVSMDSIKNLCCWPCSRGKISMTLSVPFGAYVPGQIIKHTLHIQNQSMSDVESFSFELSKKITFTAKTPHHKTRIIKKILNSGTSLEKCLRQSNRVIMGEMYIPSTTPTTNMHDIIYVEYKLKAILKTSGCGSNPHITVPIIIGTKPIIESLENNQHMAFNSQQQNDAIILINIPVIPMVVEEKAAGEKDALNGEKYANEKLLDGYKHFDNNSKVEGAELPTTSKPPSFEEATQKGKNFY